MQLTWDYNQHTVDLSMPQYVQKALQRFGHMAPPKPQHAPYAAKDIQYGSKSQQTEAPNLSPSMAPDRVKRLQ
jgi:hypothetical protein